MRSFDDFVEGKGGQGMACGPGLYHKPRVRFRSPLLDAHQKQTLAVIPFLNRSGRRGAGEAVALEIVRQLHASGRYHVLEPGVVRDYLLRARVIMPGGISLETTRLLLGALGVDLALSGEVLDYAETGGFQGSTIQFVATMLEGGTGEVLWQSTSFNRGDDGVFMFGLGRVATSGDLTCRMVSGVVDRMTGSGGASKLPPRDRWKTNTILGGRRTSSATGAGAGGGGQ
jgi:hypothetical protein